MQAIVAILLLAIVASLGRAMFAMGSGPDQGAAMVRALTARIALSIALFALLFVCWHFGWIQPMWGR